MIQNNTNSFRPLEYIFPTIYQQEINYKKYITPRYNDRLLLDICVVMGRVWYAVFGGDVTLYVALPTDWSLRIDTSTCSHRLYVHSPLASISTLIFPYCSVFMRVGSKLVCSLTSIPCPSFPARFHASRGTKPGKESAWGRKTTNKGI